MPEIPNQERRQESMDEDLRFLLREHLRLRGDMEKILEKQQQLFEQGQDRQQQAEEPEQKEQKKPEEQKKEDKQKQPQLSARQKFSAWVHTHPFGALFAAILLIVLAVAGYFFWQYLESYVNTDDAEIDGHTSQIGSRIAGTVVAVYVEDSRSVNKGQTLVDLDPRDYETALTQAQANLAQAVAALRAQAPNVPITQTTEATAVAMARLEVENAEAALESARRSHESAVEELNQAQANADNAAAEERRYRALVEKEEVSREQYDRRATESRALNALTSSRRASAQAADRAALQRESMLAEAREHLKEAQANQPRQVSVQQSNLATRRGNVAAAQAQVEQARLNLSYCKIQAPMDGIVGNKTVEVGQQVAPGQELFALTPTDDIWVTANFKETQIQNMHPGQAVKVHVDAIDLDFDAYVQNMPGATGARYSLLPPENATGNYVKVVQRLPVRIRLKSGQIGMERLRPGMSVEPKVWVK